MKKEIILKAYSVLDDLTPLKYDCGELCGKLCCSNNSDEEQLGMWLLPGEAELLKNQRNFKFTVARDNTESVICNGKCNRNLRPFSCRIYPYYASLDATPCGKIYIRINIDPRAKISCPIAQRKNHIRPKIAFLSGAKKAIRILLTDKDIRDDIIKTSDFLKSIEEMREKLLDKG